jgi:photosystem II stability/assembly factor-like uncharacterized protein
MGGPVARPGEVLWNVDPGRPRIGLCAVAALAVAIVLAGCAATPPPSASPSPSSRPPSLPPSSSPAPELTPVPTAAIDPADFTPSVIAFFDSDHGLAGGTVGAGDAASGAIASTTDGGATWTIRDGVTSPVSELAIAGNEAWALIPCAQDQAGSCGTILHSADAGQTWDLFPTSGPVVPGAGAMSFVDASTGWAVGAAPDPNGTTGGLGHNRLLQTSDGGRTWTAGPVPCGPDWQDLMSVQFVDARHGWAVCTGGGSGTMAPTQVLETLDGGATWSTRSSASSFGGPVRLVGRPPSGPVVGAEFTKGGLGVVWQGRSGTERSRDGGRTWSASGPARAEEEFVSSMSFVSEKTGFAVYSSTEKQAIVLGATDDGGDHWRIVQSWPR